ncbi:MAG: helix-turn-helix domain-containing protein [Hyphomicrobiales bacterium]|nr:helix-turn-helix domain-containing protein [Hyphomicrobiales bacterium]
MFLLDIGVLAEKSGVPASTLRYYEEIGLIESLGRRGLRRQYGPETLTQLALISLGKLAGFSLEEIKSVFGRQGITTLPRQALHGRADDIDAQIRRLTTLRNALRHVAECTAPSHMECPKFQALLRMAPHSQPSRKRRRAKAS